MAGKKIDGGTIVLKTTDGGSFKVTAAEAKKLTKQVDKLGGASQRTDRRIKGVTGQSSNASKNFSKQAQTMQGGIVAVYATIAAQIFAVSAAYQFLKNSFETRNLIEGQKQFGAVTGIAYQSITNRVQEATSNMLQFKEAAQGVAIGVAAGLSAGALEKLGEAAKNASLALGRDVTDSFNRLIRGVTKAEPELLDELGIVLRLENATTKYGVAIGKTREQLNAYERTQAVLNDVLEQAETKYKVIGEVMDPDAFALGQLTKEIDELMMSFQTFVANALTPLIGFFKNNALALVAAMGLFVLPIIKSLLPDLGKGMENAAKRSEAASIRMKDSFLEAKDAMTASKLATADPVKTRQTSAAGMRGLGVKTFKGGDDQLNARQIAAYKRHMRDKTGIYKKFNMTERAAFRKHLLQQEAALRSSTGKQVGIVSKGEYQKQALSKMTTAVVLWGEKQKQAAMAFTAKWGMRLMSMMGWVGILAMVIQGIVSLVQWMRDLDEDEKALREETEKTTEALSLLNEELSRMGGVRDVHMNLMTLKMSVEQLGNALQSTDLAKQLKDYHRELDKGADADDEVIEGFAKMAENLTVLNPQFEGLAEAMKKGERISSLMSEELMRVQGGMINAGMAAKSFTQNQESLNKSLDATIRKFAKVPYQELEKNLQASVGGIEDSLGIKQSTGIAGEEFAKGAKFMKSDEIPPMLLAMFGTRQARTELQQQVSSEFGFFAEAEIRKQERIDKKKGLSESLDKAVATSGSDRQKRFKVDAYTYDAAGLRTGVKSLETLKEEIMQESGRSQQQMDKWFTVNQGRRTEWLETIRKAYDDQGDQRQELIDQAKKDKQESIDKINVLREQYNLEKRIALLQKEGFDLNSDLAGNALNIAKAKANQVNASYLINQGEIKDAAMQASKLKVQQKVYDQSAAATAVQAAQEKIRTSEMNKIDALLISEEEKVKKKTELLELDEDAWKKRILTLGLSDQELDNTMEALRLSGLAITAQENLTSIELRKLLIQKEALVNAAGLATFAKEQAMWAREYKNALAEASRIMKQEGGSPAAKAANRATKLAQLKGNLDTKGGTDMGSVARAGAAATSFAGMAGAVQETRINAAGDAEVDPTVVMGGMLGEKMNIDGKEYTKYLQPITDAQKLYNLYLDKANAQKQVGVVLGEKTLDLENQIAGVYIQGTLKAKTDELKIDRETIANLNPASKIYWQEINKLRDDGVTITDAHIIKTKALALEQANLGIEIDLLNGIQNTLSNGFQSMFQSLIDGTKSFKDSMKDLAKSVLADLAAMFMKAAALKFMLAMFPGMGGGTGTFSSLFGSGNEGLGSGPPGDRYGGIRSGYATGGIAQGKSSGYLAKLHGTEAIVPLGNDRSIPVDIRQASGNIVNVSISMQGGQSQTSASGGGDMQALGRSIGGLVQQHLQVEMRPGGLLNRQGAKGRGG